jgi:hypothetical protein
MPKKNSDIKYVSLGLLIGLVIGAIGIGALAFAYFSLPNLFAPDPASIVVFDTPADPSVAADLLTFTPGPTLTPTTTPTNIPAILSTPFNVPSPAATLSAIKMMVDSGQIQLMGPLSEDLQIKLYNASLQYVAATTSGSLYLSKEINGVKYGNASNTCGPLAIAILRDAGLISPDVVPHDFWLLNPGVPNDRRLLNRTFPSEKFEHAETKYPITRVDWKAFPLKPGDFMYIKSGTGGNFDHMMTINRIDSKGRVYAVTNYATEFGFVITEAMVMDPNDPKAGLFYTWTKKPNQILGSTGFGGFELWRMRSQP